MAKGSVKKSTQKTSVLTTQKSPEENKSFFKKVTSNKVILILGILIIIAIIYLKKDLFIVATVNGQPISRLSVINELEGQAGKQVLDQLVTKSLILQEAKKQNVNISQKDIDSEIEKVKKELEKNGQSLDQLMQFQNLTKEKLNEQIKIQLIIDRILGKNITVTDKEVNDYLEKNKDVLDKNKSQDELKVGIKDQIKQQKLSDEFKAWVTQLQTKAKINYYVKF
ncbi:MAG: SurA N-terminal domain-containing protein [Patescibacteria group bacterium]|nr:SurA N-terminal domain-containing protein [Patescibacteria group bacterium]